MIKKEGLFSNIGMTESDRCLHTPGGFAKKNLLYVQEVGRLQSLKPHKCIRENLDSYLIMLVLEGNGELTVNGVSHSIGAGTCAFIDCMKHYEHISDEVNAWKLAWVHFNGNIAKSYYDLFMKYNNSNSMFYMDDISELNSIIDELLNKQKERNLRAELVCGELLMRLLNTMIENVSDIKTLEDEQMCEIVRDIRETINEKYLQEDLLNIIEEQYKKDIDELSSIFAHQFGIGIVEYVKNRRFNAAKELLRFSIKPMEEVAKESGLGNTTNMQKLFEELEGMSAEEYRAKWAQWIR